MIDGVDLKSYGVFIKGSDGITNRPKLKAPASVSWDDYHGAAVDLQRKFYEPREITLKCFIKADNIDDFLTKLFSFEQIFDKPGTNRLFVETDTKPLIFEVYCRDEIGVSKEWSKTQMIGTFNIKLIEPEPVKRVLKHTRTGDANKTCSITLTTVKLLNIYWGDGKTDFDVSGQNITVTHDYATNGEYYPVITGCIDEITAFSTNATMIWNKL